MNTYNSPTITSMTMSNMQRSALVLSALVLTACASDAPLAPASGLPERLAITRSTLTPLASFGDTALVSTTVSDAEGRTLSGVPLRYSVSSPEVLEPLGPGVFRARANGTAVIRVQVDPSATGVRPAGYFVDKLTDSITVMVQQQPARIEPVTTDSTYGLLGLTRTILVRITDARGNLVTAPLTPQWTITNPAIATIDNGGRVTARSNGSTNVSIRAGNATWTGTVLVNATRAHVSCMQYLQRRRQQQQCVTNSVTMRAAAGGNP